jgi:hypothetical protein
MLDNRMTAPHPGFFARLGLAFVAFFRTIFDAAFGAQVLQLRRGELPRLEPSEAPPQPQAPAFRETSADAALQLLGILQREGRFVDFLEEDISAFSDAEVGTAARVVHEGCRRTLREHLSLAPVRTESEGERVTVPAGFDAAQVRLTGNVVGEAPFTGTLQHRGWRVTDIRLPQLAVDHDPHIIAPAELEL